MPPILAASEYTLSNGTIVKLLGVVCGSVPNVFVYTSRIACRPASFSSRVPMPAKSYVSVGISFNLIHDCVL
jgi:hypothetical protein